MEAESSFENIHHKSIVYQPVTHSCMSAQMKRTPVHKKLKEAFQIRGEKKHHQDPPSACQATVRLTGSVSFGVDVKVRDS